MSRMVLSWRLEQIPRLFTATESRFQPESPKDSTPKAVNQLGICSKAEKKGGTLYYIFPLPQLANENKTPPPSNDDGGVLPDGIALGVGSAPTEIRTLVLALKGRHLKKGKGGSSPAAKSRGYIPGLGGGKVRRKSTEFHNGITLL